MGEALITRRGGGESVAYGTSVTPVTSSMNNGLIVTLPFKPTYFHYLIRANTDGKASVRYIEIKDLGLPTQTKSSSDCDGGAHNSNLISVSFNEATNTLTVKGPSSNYIVGTTGLWVCEK